MNKKILLLFLLLFTLKLYPQTNIPGGEVSGEWTKANSPYIINGDISIINQLIIDPGVEILFEDGVRIDVSGKFIAKGTKNDSIIFKNSNYKWGGLHFQNSSSNSILKYFSISGVRNVEGYGGALSVDNSNNTVISHGSIFNNSSEYQGGGIILRNLNNFVLSNILLYKNSLYNEGGGQSIKYGTAIYIGSSNVQLINITATKNTFSDSVTGTASTIHWDGESEVSLTNCIVHQNDSFSIERFNTNDLLYINYSNISGLEQLRGSNSPIVGEGNYDEMSSFIDFENDYFNLQWTNYPDINYKPKEVDGGLPSVHDEDGSISDIGAIPFYQQGSYFPPTAFLDANEFNIKVETEVRFINNSQKGSEDISSYYWDFGDGKYSYEFEPVHKYIQLGRFKASLTVTDSKGISDTKYSKEIISGTLIEQGEYFGEWDKSNNPYLIEGNITIPEGKKLTINKGVEILFKGYNRIDVYGDFLTQGTDEEKVIITALDTLNFWDNKNHYNYYTREVEYTGWEGIKYYGNNLNSSIEHTNFSYCRKLKIEGNNPSEPYGGTILIMNNKSTNEEMSKRSNFLIKNCKFYNNIGETYTGVNSSGNRGSGVNAFHTNVTIENCIFENNRSKYSVSFYAWESDNSKIINNVFRNNSSSDGNAWSIITVRGSSDFQIMEGNQILIKNNKIENNKSGGIEVIGIDGDVLIEGNTINYNTWRGVWVYSSNPVINRNSFIGNYAFDGAGILSEASFSTITNNFFHKNKIFYYWGQGSAILTEHGNTYIVNNTLTENDSEGIGGEAIYGDNSTFTAINNILYNNPKGNFGQNNGGGVYPPIILLNNYEGDPLFQEDNIPELNENSPCIDKGTLDLPIDLPNLDFFGNPRIFGLDNLIDIGAVEFNNSILSTDKYLERNNKFIVYPNPTYQYLKIISNYDNIENVDIDIYTIEGKQVKTIKNYNLSGTNNIISIEDLSSGLYFLSISNNNLMGIVKIIVE